MTGAQAAYRLGSFAGVAGGSAWLLVDLHPSTPAVTACWRAIQQSRGVDEVLAIIREAHPVRGFALVRLDGGVAQAVAEGLFTVLLESYTESITVKGEALTHARPLTQIHLAAGDGTGAGQGIAFGDGVVMAEAITVAIPDLRPREPEPSARWQPVEDEQPFDHVFGHTFIPPKEDAEPYEPDLYRPEPAAIPPTPVSQTPVSQTPVSQTPVSQTPVSQTPVSQTPAREVPVQQAPERRTPVVVPPPAPPREVDGMITDVTWFTQPTAVDYREPSAPQPSPQPRPQARATLPAMPAQPRPPEKATPPAWEEDEGDLGRTTARTIPLRDTRPGVPMVDAAQCPQGHYTDPSLATCRTCGVPVTSTVVARIPRPSLGRLMLLDETPIPLLGDLILGRSPGGPDGTATDRIQLPTNDSEISRRHLHIRLDGWHVVLLDISTNGSLVRPPAGPPIEIRPGEEHVLVPGSVVQLSAAFYFTFEAVEA